MCAKAQPSVSPPRPTQQLIESRIGPLAAARLHIVQVKILLLAEGPPPPKGQLVALLAGIIIPVLDGGIGVRLVLKCDKAIVAAPLPKVKADVENWAKELESLPQLGLQGSLSNAANINDTPLLYLPLLVGLARRGSLHWSATAVPSGRRPLKVAVVVEAAGPPLLSPRVRGNPGGL